jgi:SAM-dependent methyltransferase
MEKPSKLKEFISIDRQNSMAQAILDHIGDEVFEQSILDIGCGGYYPIGGYFYERGADVTFIDAREKNLSLVKRIYPDAETIRVNMELEEEYEQISEFDFIICAGLVYHLKDPRSAIELICKRANKSLFLETEFCDCNNAAIMYRKKEKVAKPNMSFSGIGCIPSITMIERALKKNTKKFYRIVTPKYNSDHYVYDTPLENLLDADRKLQRGIWVAFNA